MKRTVFLTGATGSIGSALVPKLLADPETDVVLMIRADDVAGLQTRLADMLTYWQWRSADAHATRIHAVRGDIAEPGLGLQPRDLAHIVSGCSHIIHCAASVKLNMSLDQARATAVTPTRAMLALARQCAESGQLQKVDLVSTVGVWGRTPGLMPERPLPEVTEFHNTYEAAKSEAEGVIFAEGRDLPITVHRPSMVVGAADSGRVRHFQVFYHLCEFLSGTRTFGVMPDLGLTRLDTVPVDWVAQVIDWSSRHQQSAGRIFHLCSGPQNAIALGRLQQEVRRVWRAHDRKVPGLRPISRAWLERLVPVIGALAGQKTRRALRGLSPVLAYLAEDQGFANTETARTLAAAGLPLPLVDSYLERVLGYYLDAQRKPATA